MAGLCDAQRRVLGRFFSMLERWVGQGALASGPAALIRGQLLRQAVRFKNPSNTGNLQDLFSFTLSDTGDPIRAYAQVLADAMKVVPLPPRTPLWPVLRGLDSGRRYRQIGDLEHLDPGAQMLVGHTMAAYGDAELWASAEALVGLVHPGLSVAEVSEQVARMAVQSQHLPSSTFVLARAAGLTVDCAELYAAAGYSPAQAAAAQRFYDTCGQFDPGWAEAFFCGQIPTSAHWNGWRAEYLQLRAGLVPELIYQLSSDTLTNFGEATMASGKWTEACVLFSGVATPEQLPAALARTVNQYVAENIALHDLPGQALITACEAHLHPWGVAFEGERAYAYTDKPPRGAALRRQFEAAQERRGRLQAAEA